MLKHKDVFLLSVLCVPLVLMAAPIIISGLILIVLSGSLDIIPLAGIATMIIGIAWTLYLPIAIIAIFALTHARLLIQYLGLLFLPFIGHFMYNGHLDLIEIALGMLGAKSFYADNFIIVFLLISVLLMIIIMEIFRFLRNRNANR